MKAKAFSLKNSSAVLHIQIHLLVFISSFYCQILKQISLWFCRIFSCFLFLYFLVFINKEHAYLIYPFSNSILEYWTKIAAARQTVKYTWKGNEKETIKLFFHLNVMPLHLVEIVLFCISKHNENGRDVDFFVSFEILVVMRKETKMFSQILYWRVT